jgi:predicted DNA binding CopG/RHH family protein
MNKKPLPKLKSDVEAETFITKADLTDYDLSSLTPVRFELKRKDKSVNLRLPEDLLTAVRARAQKEGIPYQRFIRIALERALHHAKP